MGKITFKADLNKCFKIPIEEQRELDCLALDLPNVEEKFQYYNHQEKQEG